MKKTITFFSTRAAMMLLTTLLLTLTAQTAWADTGYDYKGADGTMRNTYTDDHIPDDWVTVLTDGTPYLSEGWNYISGNINLTDGISVSAPDAETDHYFHLILADGASLTINLESSSCISIGARCCLTIYGQTNGTGTLNVTSQNYSHAIEGGTGSSITLYGGIINANAGGSNYGIFADNIYLAGATVYASSYGGNVSASCKYKDSDNNEYEGSIYNTGAIAGKTLTPFGTVASTSVMLDPQGGSGGTESVTVTNGAAMPTITPPTRTGYTFGGYYDGMDGAGTKYYNADGSSANNWNHTGESFVLSAKWTANTYTVNLDPQEGSGGTGSVTVTYDAAMPSATMPTRTGYTFCGYFTGTNGGGIKYYNADGSSAHTWDITTDNTTLYAYWKKLLTNGDIHVDIPAQTYSGTVLDPVVTVKDGETVISNDNNEHYTIALPEGRTNADDFVVTITAKDESALYAGSVTATFTINKAPLTVTANNKSIKYGDMADNNGVTYSGFVENEDERVLGGTLGFEYNYNQYDPVGNYDITPSGLTAANYDITFASGTLTVAKKSLTITANDHRILYGNAEENNGVSYAGFVNGETENVLSGELKYTYTNDSGPYGAGNDAPGEYDITPYGDDVTATNYAITFVPGKLTVEAITVKVKVVDIDNGEELTGAHVQVLNTEENFVEEWDSGTGIHEVGGLKAGKTYTVHETVAPDGYLLPTDKTFTIATNGTVTYSGATTDESGNTVLLVQNSMTHVEVSVVGTHNEGKLSGATVQVLDTENNVVEEWTSTTENYVIEGLKTSEEYTVRETVAPNNYLLSLDYTFTIDQEGKITSNGPTTVESGKTVLLVQNDMCINLSVAINWYDFENKYSVRPTTVTVTLSDGTNEASYPLNNDSNPLTCTVEKLQKYKNGTEIVYSWTITGELDCYEQSKEVNGTTTTFAMNLMYNGNCGQPSSEDAVRWDYNIDSKTITISGSGPGQMADYASADAQPWKAYRSELVSITIGSGVTSIGNNAFAGCTSLTSIDIPANVTSIGNNAFAGCSSLKTVTMLGDNPPTLGKDPDSADSDTGPFNDSPLSVILVPNETAYTAYMNAETWNGTATDAEENTTDYTGLLAPAAITLGVSTSGWATYCHKYIVNYSVEDGEAYTVSGIDNSNVQAATAQNVAPYTPTLVYKENGGNVTLTALPATATQVVPDNYNEGLGIVQETIGSVTIQGVPGEADYNDSGAINFIFAISDFSDTQSYVLRNGNFVAVDKDGGIGAHRCWLNVTKNTTNGARMLGINTGGENTGIETTNFTNPANSSGAWYGIDGRKLDKQPTKKGLYIYNGKKHVIK